MKSIIENNKLIAEFMGLWQSEIDYYYNSQFEKAFKFEEMKYHSSWGWLMSVVEKVESLGYWVEIIHSNLGTNSRPGKLIWCEIGKENHTDLLLNDCYTKISRSEDIDKLFAVYKAVIEFIQWYNQQKA